MYGKSVELLNKAVADELYAVHQYLYFHFHCEDQGLDILAGLFRRTAVEEMAHVATISERILFLKGDVILNTSEKVEAITDAAAMLVKARDMEEQSIRDYNAWAIESGAGADSVTKKLFEELVADEERHYGQWDEESEKLQKYGANYLALQSLDRTKNLSQMPPGQNTP